MIEILETGEQFEAMVGSAKTGLLSSNARSLTVSVHLPPPTAMIASAFCTFSSALSRSTFSKVAWCP